MTENTNPQDQLWLMLGEIRGDLKYLVNERRSTNERLAAVEENTESEITKLDERVGRLEHFKTKIAAYTAVAAVAVPTGITIALQKMGVMSP